MFVGLFLMVIGGLLIASGIMLGLLARLAKQAKKEDDK
jgi:hypothetical protein